MTREEIVKRLEYLDRVISNGYEIANFEMRMSHPNAMFFAERTMAYVMAFVRERKELEEKLKAIENE